MKKPISVIKSDQNFFFNQNGFGNIQYQNQTSIENGYFIFTLMPSLRCSLNCPHCYLSLEQRRNSEILSLENLELICNKIDQYYVKKEIKNKTIVNYWYGGEPTEMGLEYFTKATDIINKTFSEEKGYQIKHVILTSLLNVDDSWFEFFKKVGNNYFQTSYDGGMRGNVYTKKWEEKVKKAVAAGLAVATISVVNKAILMDGAKPTLDYLSNLGIVETGWLPFMWNEQNNGNPYDTFAPKMDEYSHFMKELSQHYLDKKEKKLQTPEIGTMRFILAQEARGNLSNIASQTLFLLPNGDFVLPDYKNGYQEFMQKFGNIIQDDFETVLQSPERRKYLKKQVLRNNNEECNNCQHADKCVMEFWKTNRDGDECFGAKQYVEWVLEAKKKYNLNFEQPVLY